MSIKAYFFFMNHPFLTISIYLSFYGWQLMALVPFS